MGFQMVATILVCAWLGRYLDEYFKTEKPYWMLALMLFGIISSITVFLRSIKRINSSKKDTDQE